MNRRSVGIIGFGGFGQFLYNSWRDHPEASVKAICEPRTDVHVPTGVKHFQDWREFLKEPGIEIVSIATPPNTHEELAIAALQHQKHVLSEKPITISMASAERILSASRNSNKILVVDFMLRFDPLVQILKSWTKENYFGGLRRVSVENYAQDESLPPDHWFWDKKQSGGILIEHGIHFIDLVNTISGARAVNVQGVRHARNSIQEDQVLANVLYDSGLIATHYHDFSRPGYFEKTTQTYVYDLAEITLEGWIPLSGKINALVDIKTADLVRTLPNFDEQEFTSIQKLSDESRPEGWGTGRKNQAPQLNVSAQKLKVTHMIAGTFHMGQTKANLYKQLVNSVLSGVIKKIANPNHELFVNIEESLAALSIAEAASSDKRNN